MTSSIDRLDRVEALLARFIDASVAESQASSEWMTRVEQTMERQSQASSEWMTRVEQTMERQSQASNERMTRVEQGLERVELIVESNNRFLESFSTDLRRYTDTMNNLATRIDGVIATSNQDRMDSNSRLAAIQRQVSAIARHLGVI